MGKLTNDQRKIMRNIVANNDGTDPLVSMYLHSFKDDTIENQGMIKARVSEGVYLVQLFGWVTGNAGYLKLMKTEDLFECRLYDDWTFWVSEGDRLAVKP